MDDKHKKNSTDKEKGLLKDRFSFKALLDDSLNKNNSVLISAGLAQVSY